MFTSRAQSRSAPIRLGADAAWRLVDNAVHRHRIAGVMHQLEEGEGVLHFLALIEARRPHQLVLHLAQNHRLFQRAALRVGAIHHREVAVAEGPCCHQPLDFVADVARLLVLVVGLIERDVQALAVFRVQALGRAVLVIGDQRVGRVEDRLRAAVVLLQQHDSGFRVVLPKTRHVAIVGSAEAVDRLVLIAHHEQVALPVRLVDQGAQHLVLHHVGVLELVHQHVGPLLLILRAQRQVLAQQHSGLRQQIVEVHGVIGVQRLLVARIDPAHDLLEIRLRRIIRRRDHLVLELADGRAQRLRAVAFLVQVHLAQQCAHQRQLIRRVVDHPVASIADGLGLHAQHARADAVKGADR